ncbi:MAG: VTT domain-containing protein [bacterium]|nr:VTT domain-containing protein [bacterium]
MAWAMLFLEGAGVPGMPCIALFLATGMLIARGRLPLAGVVAVGAAAILAGNLAGYLVGRRVGVRALAWLARRAGYRRDQAERATRLFRRYGGLAILAGRWFLPLRAPTLVLAGQAGFPLPLFLLFSLPSAVGWVLAWQYGAFALARGTFRWAGLADDVELLAGLLGLAAILVAAGWLAWTLVRHTPERG